MSQYVGEKPNEIFCGNHPANEGIPVYLRSLKTIRIGEQALDIHGKKLPKNYMLPIFICRSELSAYNTIMMKEQAAEIKTFLQKR